MLEFEHQQKIALVIEWLEEALDAENEPLVERLHGVLTRMIGLIPGGGILDASFIETIDLPALEQEVHKGLAPAASQTELLNSLGEALERETPEAGEIYQAFRSLVLKLAHDHTDRTHVRSQDG